jgi:TatD DNase family protein
MLIDTHAHLYVAEFESDRLQMIERARAAGVEKIVLPNIDRESTASMMDLHAQFPSLCWPAIGLHPCSVEAGRWEQDLAEMKSLLVAGHPFVGIGETGLDLYWDQSTLDIQIAALEEQCRWALEFSLPIILHTREATRQCIDVVKPWAEKGMRGVFHCFSGSVEEAKEVAQMGFFLGIGGVVTFKKSNLPELVRQVPAELLLLETDAPYLAPVPYRGKRNESAYLSLVAEALGEHLLMGPKAVAALTTENAQRLFAKL